MRYDSKIRDSPGFEPWVSSVHAMGGKPAGPGTGWFT